MTRIDLDAIKARAEAATADEYDIQPSTHEDGLTIYSKFSDDYRNDDEGGDPIGILAHEADAEFIAHAREDVPALVAEVERLQGLLDRTFRAYLSIQGIPDDQIDAEIARRNSGSATSAKTDTEQGD